ncbi:MAG: hypothetical protein M5U15_06170 [Kiritimatiellae bacterium]|nr:hypothetical protein [Kiritimatiellia bacterium]
MQIVADTHVHLYPFYDLGAQLDAAVANLRRAAPSAEVLALCLAERSGQAAYRSLKRGEMRPENWEISRTEDENALLAKSGRAQLWLLAGRQIVTAERIEVLALGRDIEGPDGEPLGDTLTRVAQTDAVAVLPWGLGKWLGRRGAIIRDCLDKHGPSDLVLADTCLRPAWFPTPALLRKARSRGFSILYGTDPLPRPHEETITGQWATLWEADWDASHPAAAWRRIIRDRTPSTSVGRRCNTFEALKRLR